MLNTKGHKCWKNDAILLHKGGAWGLITLFKVITKKVHEQRRLAQVLSNACVWSHGFIRAPPFQDSYRRNEYDHRLIQECSFRISAHIYSEDLTAHP